MIALENRKVIPQFTLGCRHSLEEKLGRKSTLGAVAKVRIVGGWVNRDLECKKPQKQFILPQRGSKTKAVGTRYMREHKWTFVHSTWSNTTTVVHKLTPLNTATKERKSAWLPHTTPGTLTSRTPQPGRVPILTPCSAEHKFRHSSFNQK